MPIHSDPRFQEPAPNELLWRYMDLAKFCALVTSGGLWFPNACDLAKDEPYEGFFPPSATGFKVPFDSKTGGERVIGPNFDRDAQLIFSNPATTDSIRRLSSINCWHSSPHESATMWKCYGVHDFALAIVSDLVRMREAFANTPEAVSCGRIRYISYTGFWDTFRYGADIILNKRLPFESEKEVRLVFQQPFDGNHGVQIKCSLNNLIKQIWVSPTAPQWFVQTVKAICRLGGITSPVHKSELYDPPEVIGQIYPEGPAGTR